MDNLLLTLHSLTHLQTKMHLSICLFLALATLERTLLLAFPLTDRNLSDTIDSSFLEWIYSLDSCADSYLFEENVNASLVTKTDLFFKKDIATQIRRVRELFSRQPPPLLYRVSATTARQFLNPETDYIHETLTFSRGPQIITIERNVNGAWELPVTVDRRKPPTIRTFRWSDVTMNPTNAIDLITMAHISNVFRKMLIIKGASNLPDSYANELYYIFYQVQSQGFYGIVVRIKDGRVIKILDPPPTTIKGDCGNRIEDLK